MATKITAGNLAFSIAMSRRLGMDTTRDDVLAKVTTLGADPADLPDKVVAAIVAEYPLEEDVAAQMRKAVATAHKKVSSP